MVRLPFFNCYAYALDAPELGLAAYPGSPVILRERLTVAGIMAGLLRDGLMPAVAEKEALPAPRQGFRLIAAFVDVEGRDAHFYRREAFFQNAPDRFWTHQLCQGGAILHTDAAGRLIVDPRQAARVYGWEKDYSQFAGFYYAPIPYVRPETVWLYRPAPPVRPVAVPMGWKGWFNRAEQDCSNA